jgi:hypothetical protein
LFGCWAHSGIRVHTARRKAKSRMSLIWPPDGTDWNGLQRLIVTP